MGVRQVGGGHIQSTLYFIVEKPSFLAIYVKVLPNKSQNRRSTLIKHKEFDNILMGE